MTISRAVVLVITLAFSSLVSAEWWASVEDDIFSGKKKASLFGEISRHQALVFDCDSQLLTLSFIEKSRKTERESFSHLDFGLVVKVDQGKVHEFDVRGGRRNDDFMEMVTADKEKIQILLREVRNAQSKIQIGIHERRSDQRLSSTASVRGSTREASRFMNACELE